MCGVATFGAGSLNLIPVLDFSLLEHKSFLIFPLTVLSYLRPRFVYNLGHYGDEGGQVRRQLATAKVPLYRGNVFSIKLVTSAQHVK